MLFSITASFVFNGNKADQQLKQHFLCLCFSFFVTCRLEEKHRSIVALSSFVAPIQSFGAIQRSDAERALDTLNYSSIKGRSCRSLDKKWRRLWRPFRSKTTSIMTVKTSRTYTRNFCQLDWYFDVFWFSTRVGTCGLLIAAMSIGWKTTSVRMQCVDFDDDDVQQPPSGKRTGKGGSELYSHPLRRSHSKWNPIKAIVHTRELFEAQSSSLTTADMQLMRKSNKQHQTREVMWSQALTPLQLGQMQGQQERRNDPNKPLDFQQKTKHNDKWPQNQSGEIILIKTICVTSVTTARSQELNKRPSPPRIANSMRLMESTLKLRPRHSPERSWVHFQGFKVHLKRLLLRDLMFVR